MKTIKNLSKNTVKANIGFNLREDLNFSDDGNYFRGFDYKGMPITTLRADGITYLSVRVDYLNNQFTFEDWSNTEEYMLADEFNGVEEIDLDKLIENCERIIAKVAELNKKAEEEEVDMEPVVEMLKDEKEQIETLLENAKQIKWWELEGYSLKSIQRAYKGLLDYAKRIDRKISGIENHTMTVKEARQMAQGANKYGYIEYRKDNYWARELREAM